MKKRSPKILLGTAILITAGAGVVWQVSQSNPVMNDASSQAMPSQAQLPQSEPARQAKPALTNSVNTTQTNALVSEATSEMQFPTGDPAIAWAKVDLDSLKEEIPDNLYWTLAAPTDDPNMQEQRKESKEYWRKASEKVKASLASEPEIRAYYDHRYQVSNDYVTFATHLLNRYSQQIPEQSYHFQVLARNLHLALLEELPKKLNNALEQRKKHENRRQEWLADKAAFEAKLFAEKEAAENELKNI